MKSYATPFAVAGALLIAALLVILNLITTPDTLWFIYPVFAVAWWPIGVCLCQKKKYFIFAAAGSILTLAFLVAVNMLTSQNLRFLYVAPPLLLLPAGVYFKDRMRSLPVALSLSILIVAYYTIVNLLLTPGRFWAIYPIFGTLWWPMSLYFTGRKQYKAFSVAGAVWTVAFFIALNLLTTAYPWALYACFPVLLWPAAMFFGKRLGGQKFSIFASLCVVIWYGALNIFHSPISPWVIFVAFPVLWWPLSVNFFGRHCPHIYALVMSALSITFFAAVNAIYSPGALWAYYPAFALLWWPITLLFAKKQAWRVYSFAASALTIAFLAAVNVITSPGFPWSVFPILGILWWPLAMSFKGKRNPIGFSVASALLAIATLLSINLITSPSFLWSIFAVLGVVWWPAGVLFSKKKSPLGFSIFGALLICATLLSINLITSPSFLWSVFPILGVLWWPTAVYSAKKKSPFGLSVAGSLLAIALLASINLMTSPGFPWCVFAVFGVLWWPLSVYFHVVRRRKFANGKA